MLIERDLRLHIYAAARLAGLVAREETCAALRAIFARPYPDAYPLPRDEERVAARKEARKSGERIRATPGVDYGFAQRLNALWVVQDALPDFDDMPLWTVASAKMMFDLGRTLYPKLASFARDAEGFAAWHEGRLRLPPDPFLLTLLTGSGIRVADLRCMGLPLFATSDDGVVWFGLTHDIEVFFDDVHARRLAGIRELVSTFPEPDRSTSKALNVVQALEPILENDLLRFHVERNVLTKVLGDRPRVIRNRYRLNLGLVEDGHVRERHGQYGIWYSTRADRKQLPARIAMVEDVLRPYQPDWIIVTTPEESDDFATVLREALRAREAAEKYLVFGRTHLGAYLLASPWVTTALTAHAPVLFLRPQDRRTLRRRLSPALGIGTRRGAVVRLGWQLLGPDTPQRVLIIGKYGNGKSTALLQLLEDRDRAVGIYLTPETSEAQLSAVSALVRELLRAKHEVVLAVDDFGDFPHGPIDALLRELPRDENLLSVVACDSRHDLGTRRPRADETLHFDAVDETFAERIVERARELNPLPPDMHADPLPYLLRGSFTISEALRELGVRTTPYRALRVEALDPDAQMVIRVLALIAMAGIEPVTVRLVTRYCAELSGSAPARTQLVLNALAHAGWIAIDGDDLFPVNPWPIGVLAGHILKDETTSVFLEEFLSATEIVAQREEAAVGGRLLTWLGEWYVDHGNVGAAEAILQRHSTVLADDWLRRAIGSHYRSVENLDSALEFLATCTTRDPSDNWGLLYFEHHCRKDFSGAKRMTQRAWPTIGALWPIVGIVRWSVVEEGLDATARQLASWYREEPAPRERFWLLWQVRSQSNPKLKDDNDAPALLAAVLAELADEISLSERMRFEELIRAT